VSTGNHLEEVAAELESLRVLLNQFRGSIALSRRSSVDANAAAAGVAADLHALDQISLQLNAARSALHSLETDIRHLQARVKNAEREAAEHKAKRADASARVRERDRTLREIRESGAWKLVKPLWKLWRRRLRWPDEANVLDDLQFAVELPKEWKTARETLLIKGWCFSGSGREIAGVRARVARKSRIALYGIERADVAARFEDDGAARRSGFSVEVRVPPGRSEVALEAIAQGGDWHSFFAHDLVCDGTATAGRGRARKLPKVQSHAVPQLLRISAGRAVDLLSDRFAAHAQLAPSGPPTFSIITPAFNTSARWFAEAGTSLLEQSFANWEWCVVDDESSDRETRKLLNTLANVSPRLHIQRIAKGGISAATNAALELATGDFVCFLDHDDVLDSVALELLERHAGSDCDVIYSDEDKLEDSKGRLVEPFFKPDWSPEYFRGAMYVGHLLCIRRELAHRVRFDPAFDGVQDFEFMLRVSETGARICHLAEPLYHWRKTRGSIAASSDAKPHITELQAQAVNAHLQRLGLAARAIPASVPHRLRIVPAARTSTPLISIIIPTKDAPELLGRCLESIMTQTSYSQFELVLIDNETTDAEALQLMKHYPARRVLCDGRFNFSRANNLGAREARGAFLAFLNNDTEVLEPAWLQHLLYYAEQEDVGAVGALLLYPDRTVQHAGIALGMRGTADHVMRRFPATVDGYGGSLVCAREVSAVTAACMMMRKSLFAQIGGFNEHFFTAYQDVDLCLRLRQQNLRIIYTPQAALIHHESTSRKKYYDMVDRMLLLDQWETLIEAGDPYYNRHLDLERGDYSVARML
jgi:GT2 family glycosyltransferase